MKILRRGTLPGERMLQGICHYCGCIIEEKVDDVPKSRQVTCPTVNCGEKIDMLSEPVVKPAEWPVRDKREFS